MRGADLPDARQQRAKGVRLHHLPGLLPGLEAGVVEKVCVARAVDEESGLDRAPPRLVLDEYAPYMPGPVRFGGDEPRAEERAYRRMLPDQTVELERQ